MNLWQLMHRTLKSHWVGGLAALFLLLGATEVIVELLQRNQVERQHNEVLSNVVTLRARLEGEINSSLHLIRGLIAYVAIHPVFDSDEFDALASEIITVGRNIRNIGLAKDNVITHIFPLAGNEAALGINYEKLPDQWPAVREAMEKRITLVAGPVDLVQGGSAFIARMPIYTRIGPGGHLEEHRPVYWGMASIVIDIPSLFDSAGIKPQMGGQLIALRGKDAKGAAGEVFFGDPSVFKTDPVVQSVMLPNGSWQIGASPKGGWRGDGQMIWLLRVGGWLAALAVGLLIAVLLRTREENKTLALHDHLTGLPNRRLLEDRIEQTIALYHRHGGGFGILYLDLDGFKAINDQYGHRIGDGLLVEVANRLLAGIRQVDTVARVGGDEFIVLVSGIADGAVLHRLGESLLRNLHGSVYVEGQKLALSASMGAALFPDDGDTLDLLLKRADRKMYEDKQRGKIYRMDQHRH